MKKTIAAVLAAVSISLAAGCAANLPAGYDKFTAAREKYETLSSGRVTMTDLTTGDEIMRFSFYFNVNDEMVFSYWGSWQGRRTAGVQRRRGIFLQGIRGREVDGHQLRRRRVHLQRVQPRIPLPLCGGQAVLPCRGGCPERGDNRKRRRPDLHHLHLRPGEAEFRFNARRAGGYPELRKADHDP